MPLITIITSTFNAAKDFHWTGDSIRKQTYPYIQWIIADGASTDDTLSVIKQYEDVVDFWFSEPDQGIYDAWNKALKYAKGEWVQFIGAGDELAEPDTLEKIAPVLSKAYPEHELVYGNVLRLTEIGRQPFVKIGESWETMKKKWTLFRPALPFHPAVFQHQSLFVEPDPFDIRFTIASDCHLLLKSIKNKKPLYFDLLIDKMPLGGVSGNFMSCLTIASENKVISHELGFKLPFWHVFFGETLLLTKTLLILVFPQKIVFKIADIFRIVCGEKPKWNLK
ncbi:MAG: glycosyltransferase family 2 protein [Desulfuromonadales bacterium]|nr:glycosyltransferase family 2 protein [Desulfuromonadales bacterium]